MEVEVLSVRGAPDEAVISIRAGSCRRQATVGALATGTTFKIPVGPNGVNPFKVDLLKPVGSARLALRPEPGSYATELKGVGEEGHDVRVDFVLKDLSSPNSAQASARSSKADHKVPKEFAGLLQSTAVAAKEYLERHQILTFVRALVQTLIRDQPEDPFGFIADQFRWASDKGGAKEAMENLDQMSALPAGGGKDDPEAAADPASSPEANGSPEATAECEPAAKPKTPPPELAGDPVSPEAGQPDEAVGTEKAIPPDAEDAAVNLLAQESVDGRVPEAMAAEVGGQSPPSPIPSRLDPASTVSPSDDTLMKAMPQASVSLPPPPATDEAAAAEEGEQASVSVPPPPATDEAAAAEEGELASVSVPPPPATDEAAAEEEGEQASLSLPRPPATDEAAKAEEGDQASLSLPPPSATDEAAKAEEGEQASSSLPPPPATDEAAKAEEGEQAPGVPVSHEDFKRQEEIQKLRDDHAALQQEVLELKKLLKRKVQESPSESSTPAEDMEQMRLMAKDTLFAACTDGSLDEHLTRIKTKKLVDEGGESRTSKRTGGAVQKEDAEEDDAAADALESAVLGGEGGGETEGPMDEDELERARTMALDALNFTLCGEPPEMDDAEAEEAKTLARDALSVLLLDKPPELSPKEELEARTQALEALSVGLLDAMPDLNEEEEEAARTQALEALGVAMLDEKPQLDEDEADEARQMALEALSSTLLGEAPKLTEAEEALTQDELEAARGEASKALSSLLLGRGPEDEPEPPEVGQKPEVQDEGDLSPIAQQRLKRTASLALHAALLDAPEPETETTPKALPPQELQLSGADLSSDSRPSSTGSITRAPIRAAERSRERALDFHQGQLYAITNHLLDVHNQADDFLARAFAESHSYHVARAKHKIRGALHELELTPEATEGKTMDLGTGAADMAATERPFMTATLTPFEHLEQIKQKAQASLTASLMDGGGRGAEEEESRKARARQALKNALATDGDDSVQDDEVAAKARARAALSKALESDAEEEQGHTPKVDIEATRMKARDALHTMFRSEDSAQAKEAAPHAQAVTQMANKALMAAFQGIDLPPEDLARAMKAAEAAIQQEVAKVQAPEPVAEGGAMSPGEGDMARLKAIGALQHAVNQSPKAVQASLRSAAEQEAETEAVRFKARQALEATMDEGHAEDAAKKKARAALEEALSSGSGTASESGFSLFADETSRLMQAKASARKALGAFFQTDFAAEAEGDAGLGDEEMRMLARDVLTQATENGSLEMTMGKVKTSAVSEEPETTAAPALNPEASEESLREKAHAALFAAASAGTLSVVIAEAKASPEAKAECKPAAKPKTPPPDTAGEPESEEVLRKRAKDLLVGSSADGRLKEAIAEAGEAGEESKEDPDQLRKALGKRARDLLVGSSADGRLNEAIAEAGEACEESKEDSDQLRKLAWDTLTRNVSTGRLEEELVVAKDKKDNGELADGRSSGPATNEARPDAAT